MAPIVARDTTQLLPMFLNTAALLGTCCARPCFSLSAQTAAAVLHAGDTPSVASVLLSPRVDVWHRRDHLSRPGPAGRRRRVARPPDVCRDPVSRSRRRGSLRSETRRARYSG